MNTTENTTPEAPKADRRPLAMCRNCCIPLDDPFNDKFCRPCGRRGEV